MNTFHSLFYVLPNVSWTIWTTSDNGCPIHFKKWHTLQKVYFCGRKTYPNSSILCHWKCTAITEFFMSTFVYVLYEIQIFCNFTPCISVDVAFLVRHFVFVVKTRIKSLFVSLKFLLLEFKTVLVRYFS